MSTAPTSFSASCATATATSCSPGWEHDYRKKYAHFICNSEAQHPLLSWDLAEWESAPPLTILHYRGKRLNSPGQPGTYKEIFTVTTENKDGQWVVTKYDSMY